MILKSEQFQSGWLRERTEREEELMEVLAGKIRESMDAAILQELVETAQTHMEQSGLGGERIVGVTNVTAEGGDIKIDMLLEPRPVITVDLKMPPKKKK